MGRLIPPLTLALSARFGTCRRSRPPALTYQLCMTSVRMSMRSSASCLSLAPISPSPMEIPALPTAACQATACGSSTLSTHAFAMRCSTWPLCASLSRLARAGPFCLKKWVKEPKRPTGRRWLAPVPPSSIRWGTRTGSLRRVRPGRWRAWCDCPSWKRLIHPSQWVSRAGGSSSIPSPPR